LGTPPFILFLTDISRFYFDDDALILWTFLQFDRALRSAPSLGLSTLEHARNSSFVGEPDPFLFTILAAAEKITTMPRLDLFLTGYRPLRRIFLFLDANARGMTPHFP